MKTTRRSFLKMLGIGTVTTFVPGLSKDSIAQFEVTTVPPTGNENVFIGYTRPSTQPINVQTIEDIRGSYVAGENICKGQEVGVIEGGEVIPLNYTNVPITRTGMALNNADKNGDVQVLIKGSIPPG